MLVDRVENVLDTVSFHLVLSSSIFFENLLSRLSC
jgi:hypothetical protein